jgi:hypothetical protein
MAASNHRFKILCAMIAVLILAALVWRFLPDPVGPVEEDVGFASEAAEAPVLGQGEVIPEPLGRPVEAKAIQSEPREAEGEDEPLTRVVHGIVTDRNWMPIANAVVHAYQPDENPVATTDRWGRFEIPGLPSIPKDTNLLVRHPDYVPESVENGAIADPSEVLAITLKRGATITGTVTFRGRPAANQVVKAAISNPFGLRNTKEARTDVRGAYTLTALEAHKARGYQVGAILQIGEEENPRIMSMEVTLEDERATIADFDFPDWDATLEGQLLFNGYPLRNKSINIVSRGLNGTREEFKGDTDSEGFYRFEALPSGILELHVQLIGMGKTTHYRAATIEIPSGFVTTQDFSFGGSGVITGYCTGIDDSLTYEGLGLLTAESFDILAATGLTELLSRVWNTNLESEIMVAEPQLAEDGSFRIENLEPGTYTLLVMAEVDSVAAYSFKRVMVTESEETHVVLGPDFISENVLERMELLDISLPPFAYY